MFKRVLITFAELALLVTGLVILIGGCSKPATADKPTAATTAEPAANETASSSGDSTTAKTPMADVPLIPREVLCGNPQRAQARLSHDGKWHSFQAPVDGVLNIWAGPADDIEKAKAVTQEKVRPIPTH